MENYVQTIYQKLLSEISTVPELKKIGVKNPLQVSDKVRTCIEELKSHFKAHPFPDRNREILFFKYEKPRIISEHIYAQEIYAIASNKPVGDRQVTDIYYTNELSYIKRAFDQYRYLYQYFQLDGVEFDELYFCRNSQPLEITLPAAPDFDPEFSTPGDFVFAKFIAFERLQEHLSGLLYDRANSGELSKPVHWTGDVVNLVELLYGLYLTGQLNNGNLSLNEFVRWAESTFQVHIGIIQRKFTEIQRRKRISPTKYMDQMKDALLRKMEEGNV